jgi:hypothetical protein
MRSWNVSEFQSGRLKGIALTIAAGGVGLTLTAASRMIFVDRDWTPSTNRQAEDRLCRIGQVADSIHLIELASSHPLERRIDQILSAKSDLIALAIDAQAQPLQDLAIDAQAIGEHLDAQAALVASQAADRAAAWNAELERIEVALESRQAMASEFAQIEEADERQARARQINESETRGGERATRAPTSMEKIAIGEIFRSMLAACDGAISDDGVGFSKSDATHARILWRFMGEPTAAEELETWEAAWRLLRRYHQTQALGLPDLRSAAPGMR